MATDRTDLPYIRKQLLIQELANFKFFLDDENPIGKGEFGYVYRTKSILNNSLGACKIIEIPDCISIGSKEELLDAIKGEVRKLYRSRLKLLKY